MIHTKISTKITKISQQKRYNGIIKTVQWIQKNAGKEQMG